MWRLNAMERLMLPEPRTLKRLAAPLLVFILGMIALTFQLWSGGVAAKKSRRALQTFAERFLRPAHNYSISFVRLALFLKGNLALRASGRRKVALFSTQFG
jgi:hypothetical protein